MGHDDTAQEEKEIHRQIGLWQERLASKNYSAVKNGNGERGDSPQTVQYQKVLPPFYRGFRNAARVRRC